MTAVGHVDPAIMSGSPQSGHSPNARVYEYTPTALTATCASCSTLAPCRQSEHGNMTTANLPEIADYHNLPQNTSGASADNHLPPADRRSNTANFRDWSASSSWSSCVSTD